MTPLKLGVVAVVCMLAPVVAQQAPPRDAQALRTRVGTAVISGRVVTAEIPPTPIRLATVLLTDVSGITPPRAAVTSDDGTFAFDGLPDGRYSIVASKAAYLPAAFGAHQAARVGAVATGTPVPLVEGQQLIGLALRLERGGVMTGIVRDSDGQPLRDASVRPFVFTRSPNSPARELGSLPMSAQTDSTGRYRIFGLPPGDYVISASYVHGEERTEQTTPADVQMANAVQPVPTVPTTSRPTFRYLRTYFPGTTDPSRADIVRLSSGEERDGLDLRIEAVQSSTISGVATAPDGRPATAQNLRLLSSSGGSVTLQGSARSDEEGRFRFSAVPPGQYAIQLVSLSGNPDAAHPTWWGRAEVGVPPGRDVVANVQIREGVAFSGRIALDGPNAASAPALSRIRLFLVSESDALVARSVTVALDGQFSLTGVIPGRYRLSASIQGATAADKAWGFTSANLGDLDLLEQFADVQADVSGVQVHLTDQVSVISGIIRDAAGKPAPDYFVIAFPADRSLWSWGSRRIVQTKPSNDGGFVFANLPAGDYLLGAVSELEQNEWFEPAFLDQLFPVSVRVALGSGEKKMQDIRIR